MAAMSEGPSARQILDLVIPMAVQVAGLAATAVHTTPMGQISIECTCTDCDPRRLQERTGWVQDSSRTHSLFTRGEAVTSMASFSLS
jgi:hypothetical protein